MNPAPSVKDRDGRVDKMNPAPSVKDRDGRVDKMNFTKEGAG
jgi:hypothetical protein